MASTRISAPMRGVAHQLSRLSIRQDVLSARCNKCLSTPFARSITTSTSSQASVTPITTSTADYVPVTPFEEQTVIATIHQFPSLEPLRFETYPANHLYLPTRKDILHRAVVYEGDMTRLGTASTKDRHEVRGSARKIRPQKGSGRARLGDKKSPMLRGGGVAFGPRPRDFATELPKKVYDLAWRTALSYRFRKGELIIVDNAMELESPSTRLLEDIFKYHKKLQGKGRNLLVTLEERPLLEYALSQMGRGEQTLTWEEVDVKNLLELSRIIIERDALHNILSSHQEDLTHTSVPPWSRNLIRRSAPADLEGIIGWSEFAKLNLTEPEALETTRPAIYESVADKRYAHAASLPATHPDRTELTVSAYNLLAEAKEMHFQQATGTPFAEYVQRRGKGKFQRIQTLEDEIKTKRRLADDAEQTSRAEGQVLELEAAALEIEALELRKEATILAAQIHEHRAEEHRLADEGHVVVANTETELVSSRAGKKLKLAGYERVKADELHEELLQTRLAHAQLEVKIMAEKRHVAAQKKAQATADALQMELDLLQAEREADEAGLGEVEEEALLEAVEKK